MTAGIVLGPVRVWLDGEEVAVVDARMEVLSRRTRSVAAAISSPSTRP